MKICRKGLHRYPAALRKCIECRKIAVNAKYAKKSDAQKEHDKAYLKAWNEANSEAVKAKRNAKYAANPEVQKRMSAARYAANKALAAVQMKAYREKHAERLKASAQKWAEDNKEKINARIARRRASKLRATPAWANRAKIEEFYYTADMLGMHTGEMYHVDHIIPLRSKLVCGLHWEGNLQILTAKENQSKGNRFVADQ